MNEMTKKKPDFSNLDFSKISGPTQEVKIEKKENNTKTIEGCWINGKHIDDVTPEELKTWLAQFLPGTGMELIEDSQLNTSKNREKVILRASITYHKIFGIFQGSKVDNKTYIH